VERERISAALQEALAKTNTLELTYYRAKIALGEARELLEKKQSDLYFDGKLNGKNEETRMAQIVKRAKAEYRNVIVKDAAMQEAKARYQSAKRTWETWQAIAQLYQ
jgi:hypothetical protein